MAFVPTSQLEPIQQVLLPGQVVRLELLSPDHESELLRISSNVQIWRYLTNYGGSPETMRTYINDSLRDCQAGSTLPYIIRSMADRQVVGMTRLKDISREHRKAIVGSWLAPFAWGKGINTEAKLVLLKYAFESLNCIRIEFHADSRNLRSRAALAKIGAVQEGILRSHIITRDGHHRNTVIFSILQREWPAVKEILQTRLRAQLGQQP
ncbi:MAG TPA: GNAT family protein [Candidatus Angelobacter sp.]|nr:GNAT family protein [Candidatus Angelobacter sp.]